MTDLTETSDLQPSAERQIVQDLRRDVAPRGGERTREAGGVKPQPSPWRHWCRESEKPKVFLRPEMNY